MGKDKNGKDGKYAVGKELTDDVQLEDGTLTTQDDAPEVQEDAVSEEVVTPEVATVIESKQDKIPDVQEASVDDFTDGEPMEAILMKKDVGRHFYAGVVRFLHEKKIHKVPQSLARILRESGDAL
jgi:hypothetical protein